MTFKDIKNKALASYKEKVKDIKKTALTGLAGLVIGAGGASGATIPVDPYYDNSNGELSWVFIESDPYKNTGVWSYKFSLWNDTKGGEYLGEIIDLKVKQYSEPYSQFFSTKVSLNPIFENAMNLESGDILRYEISQQGSPLRIKGVDFETREGFIEYSPLQTSLMNSNSIPEPSTLGLLGLGAVALKKSRKDKKKD